MAAVSIAGLCLVGVTALIGRQDLLALIAAPLVFTCSLLVVLYTLFALRLGSISTIGGTGQVYLYTRKKEPIAFFFLAVFYLIVAVPSAIYTGCLLFCG
jgi:hypothetical protein